MFYYGCKKGANKQRPSIPFTFQVALSHNISIDRLIVIILYSRNLSILPSYAFVQTRDEAIDVPLSEMLLKQLLLLFVGYSFRSTRQMSHFAYFPRKLQNTVFLVYALRESRLLHTLGLRMKRQMASPDNKEKQTKMRIQ